MSDGIQEALEKVKAIRAESQDQPQDESQNEAVDVTEAEFVEVVTEEPETETEQVAETDELVEDVEDQPEADDGEADTLIFDINGKEYSQETISEALEGNLRLSDYTRKTQAVAEDRKALEADREKQTEQLATLQTHIDMASEMHSKEFDNIDWEALRESDTAEYLRLKELQGNASGKLEKAKAARDTLLSDQRQEQRTAASQAIVDLNPSWIKDGEATQQYEDDQKLLIAYVQDNKFPQADIDLALTSGPLLNAVMKAARLDARIKAAPAATKRVKKAPPTVVKGRKASVTGIQKQVSDAKAKLKRTGKLDDAMALKRLERKL